MSDSDRSNHNFLTGLLLGVLAGAGLFYFLTKTEKGKEIKKVIEKKGKEALEDLEELIDQIEKKGQEFKTQALKVQQRLEGEFSSQAKEGLSQVKRLRQRGEKTVKFFLRNGKPLKLSTLVSASNLGYHRLNGCS